MKRKGAQTWSPPSYSRRGKSGVPWDPTKKQKSDKTASATPLVLMEGDLDEIGDVARNTIELSTSFHLYIGDSSMIVWLILLCVE